MDDYDLVIIGTGSAMNLLEPYLEKHPGARVAVIDKDEPGGICLTQGCIPTKLLVQAADTVRLIEGASSFGITAPIQAIDFAMVMANMRQHVDAAIGEIRQGLRSSESFEYFPQAARFVAPRELSLGDRRIRGKSILLCTGSKPLIPDVDGLKDVNYHTSDTILHITELPKSMLIMGGGYIAAEYGHFFSAMGTDVTILGRNPQFLPAEEPEIAAVVLNQMRQHMRIETGWEIKRIQQTSNGIRVQCDAKDVAREVEAQTLLVAAGRASNSDVLDPAAGGIAVDEAGWIKTDEYLETSQPGVWAFGDANGKHQFKHKANHESILVWRNAFGGEHVKAVYDAVPRAVFTHPQVAAVGLGEKEAVARHGRDGILVGFQRYEDTAKGKAMHSHDHFVKAIVLREDLAILGAHIVGPEASTLIQEIINLMGAPHANAQSIVDAMHIHPALPEVVQRAFSNLMTVEDYHQRLDEAGLVRHP